ALQALADRDILVVATTGTVGRDHLDLVVPDNARVIGFVPFAELLPRVDLVITNGGWGGTLATLAQGVPLIIAGGDLDKPEVAARVAFSGAGINLRTGTPTAAAIAAAVDRVMADGSYREAAERMAADLARLGGAERAAELVARSASDVVHPDA
ncbi:MAG: glycosyltransferase, partial [Actinobacteria bacterium]|nr:glycosyltransferase [Actinomycetota bacterium]